MRIINGVRGVLLILLLTSCIEHATFWLERSERYVVNKGDTPIFSFQPPDQRRWYVAAPITLKERGFVRMTTYLDNGVRLQLTFWLNEMTSNYTLAERRLIRDFFTEGDVGIYVAKDRKPIMFDGSLIIRDRSAVTIGEYECAASAKIKPTEVVPNVYSDGVRISCPLVVDGKVILLTIDKTISITHSIPKQEYKEKTAHVGGASSGDSFSRLFDYGIQRSVDSLIIFGEKISQNIEDVDDVTIFEVPRPEHVPWTRERQRKKNKEKAELEKAKNK